MAAVETFRPTPPAPSTSPTLEEQAYIALQRGADRLQRRFAHWLKPHALSPTQYNALRILRGAGERGLPCREIGERMIARDPDITRLVDRLTKRGLVERSRSGKDRRIVHAAITPAGLELLRRLDGALHTFMEELLGPLGQEKLRQLVELVEASAADAGPASDSCP